MYSLQVTLVTSGATGVLLKLYGCGYKYMHVCIHLHMNTPWHPSTQGSRGTPSHSYLIWYVWNLAKTMFTCAECFWELVAMVMGGALRPSVVSWLWLSSCQYCWLFLHGSAHCLESSDRVSIQNIMIGSSQSEFNLQCTSASSS